MWLIGMMGSGKSTVGELAARRLHVPFHDTDRMVEEASGMSVADLWRERGEPGFRDLEAVAVAEVPPGGVAAAGGGAVLRPENRSVIAGSGVVVWLRCSPVVLARRAHAGVRPLLGGEGDAEVELRRLLEERAPLCESLATHQVDTTERSIDQVVSEVVGSWPG